MQENVVAPLRDELIDLIFRQEEIISELRKLVESTDKDEKILSALRDSARSLGNLEGSYKKIFMEFERAAYGKAVEYFNL